MKKILTLIVCCALFQAAAGQHKDEAAVAGAVSALRQAMINADKAALEKLTATKLTYGHSNGRLEDKAAFVGNIVNGQSDFVTMDLKDQTIAITGQTAIVRHTLGAEINDGGKPGTVNLYVMLVWAKEGGQWKLAARQAVKIPPVQ